MTETIQYIRQWDIKDFVDKSSMLFECICQLCGGVLSDPLIDEDEHIFCSDCIEKFLSKSSFCPIDKKPLTKKKLVKPSFINKTLQKQKVFCKNSDCGCLWIGERNDFDKHIKESCEFQKISCTNKGCKEEIAKRDLNKHKLECEFEAIQCPYCSDLSESKDALEGHFKVCKKFVVLCFQNCGIKVLREELETHITSNCINTLVECQFYPMGCVDKFPRKNIDEHMETNKGSHLTSFLLNFQNEMIKTHQRLDDIEKYFEINDKFYKRFGLHEENDESDNTGHSSKKNKTKDSPLLETENKNNLISKGVETRKSAEKKFKKITDNIENTDNNNISLDQELDFGIVFSSDEEKKTKKKLTKPYEGKILNQKREREELKEKDPINNSGIIDMTDLQSKFYNSQFR
jgi:hypothetical protein